MDLDTSALATKVANLNQAAITAAMPLSEAAKSFLLVSGPAFRDLLAATVQRLAGRSSAPADFELTIFDRVLLALTGNGTNLDSAAAVVFFLRHYFNFDFSATWTNEVVPELDNTLSVLATVQAYTTQSTARDVSSSAQLPSSSTNVDDIPSQINPAINLDPNLQRLLDTYQEACNEYLIVEKLRDESTLKAAKYLRDTAENAILFLNVSNIGADKLNDIRTMSDTAKSVVQDLTGGKVRKWDEGYQEEVPNPNSKRKLRAAAFKARSVQPMKEEVVVRAERRSRSPTNRSQYHHRPEEYAPPSHQPTYGPGRGRSYSRSSEAYPPQIDKHTAPRSRDYPTIHPADARDSTRDRTSYRSERTSYPEQRASNIRREHGYSNTTRDRHAPATLEDRGRYDYVARPSTEDRGRYDRQAPISAAEDRGRYDRQASISAAEDRGRYERRTPPPTEIRGRYDSYRSAKDPRVSEREKIPMPGRGHSGIPYGYSTNRDVDSWKPGQS